MVRCTVYNARQRMVPTHILRFAPAPQLPYTLPTLSTTLLIYNMLTAVSSWEPAYTASPETVSPASSCYPSPTRSLYGRTRAELEAAEALLMLSGSAPNRQYYRSYEQPTLSYQYPGLSYSQAGISYQLVGPAQPGNHALQAFPGQPFERKMATPIYAEVEEPIAGPSEPRGSGASSPRFVPKAHSMSPAPEQARAPSALAERSRSPTPAPTKPLSETSSVGPQRTAKSKGKARASPIATTTEETKGRKRKAKAKPEPKEPVKFNPADPRPYYIDRAEWIGLNLETGEPMAGVPPMKSPATEYQAHILAWIFDNVTPQPDKFWKAVVATKLSM